MRPLRKRMGRIGLQMLARMAQAERDAVKLQQAAIMLDRDLASLGERQGDRPAASVSARLISPRSQGRPSAARPTITPSAPERRSARLASSRRSDVAIDDERDGDGAFHGADRRPIRASLVELRTRAAVNRDEACSDRLAAPSELRRVRGFRPQSQAASSRSRARSTARTTEATMRSARSGSRISAEPQSWRATRLAGQPMLMSMTSAPECAAIRAACAMHSGSRPAIWTICGDTPSPSSLSLASSRFRASSGEAIISLTTPAAPRRPASRASPHR